MALPFDQENPGWNCNFFFFGIFILNFQREYTQAIENGELPDRNELYKRIMEKESPWLQLVGPSIMSGQQNNKLEDTVEKFERLLKESKEIQTELPSRGMSTQVEKYEQVINYFISPF